MGVKVTNNAFGTLSTSINTSATTVVLDSGQGARFPTLGSGDFFFATLIDTSNNLEIVKVTARSSDSMTVTRAQDNTTALAFAIGDRFELRPTAALFEEIINSAELSNDTSPQLGGNLDLNSNNINDGTLLLDSSRIRVPNASSNPSSPNAGDMYYNTTEKVIKHYDGTDWLQMTNKFSAVGGAEASYSSGGVSYKSHTFTSSGSFEVSSAAKSVDYLIVAGGGGGHGSYQSPGGGGGGAGGMITGTATLAPGTYTITVGAGGTYGRGDGSSVTQRPTSGQNSSISSVSGASATGGGYGGGYSGFGAANGGSGGGEGFGAGAGSGTSGQGNNGGTASQGQSQNAAGGGGKGAAGGVGNQSTNTTAGAGGSGGNNDYRTGSNIAYAGGGGGGGGYNQGPGGNNGGAGGNGGGGAGGRSNSSGNCNASSASANTGGGGGGAGGPVGSIDQSQQSGGNGGSGIVVIRYAI